MSDFLSLDRHPCDDVMGLNSDGTHISWGVFYDNVRTISSYVEDQQVVLACSDIYNFTVSFTALVHMGANIVLPPNLQRQTLQDIVKEQGAVIINDEVVERHLNAEKTSGEKVLTSPYSQRQSEITLYTSGSTGAPTQIKRHLSLLEEEVIIFHKQWGRRVKGGVFATSVAHFHAYGLPFCILWALYSGAPLALQQVGYPEELECYAKNHHINFIAAPAFFKRHYDFFKPENNNAKALSHLKFITSAGSPLPSRYSEGLADILPSPIVEIYGSTETGAVATLSVGDQSWRCLDGVKVGCTEDGHIHVSSPVIGKDNTIVLKDSVRILEKGGFVLRGRSDRIVKVFEKRVSIDRLEALCLEHEWVGNVSMVVLSPSERLGAVVTLTEEGASALTHVGKGEVIKTLRTYLLDSFDLVVLPRKWRFVKEIPMNSMGKTHNQSLLAFFDDK